MNKVLKSTLIEFLDAAKRSTEARKLFLQKERYPRSKRREKRKLAEEAWGKAYLLASELEWQSGIRDDLFHALADILYCRIGALEDIYSVLKILNVEVADKQWYFEGELHYSEKTERYAVVKGNEFFTLNIGDKISINEDGFWFKTRITLSPKKRTYYLLGCRESMKLEGKRARVLFEVAE